MSSLKKLTIACLRGCTTQFVLPFESGKKLTILYGENATGKSTVCDAFEFIGKGRIGSLENRGLGRTESYWPSFGKNAADIVVTLETSEGSCVGKIGESEVACAPENLRPRVEVLRRARILDLVEAQGAEKYKAIERFIDVAGPETAEGALRDLIKGLKQNQKVALARVGENQTAIEQSWAIDGKPGTDAFSWADSQSKIDTTLFDAESRRIETLTLALSRVKDAAAALPQASAGVERAKESLAIAKQALEQTVQTAAADAGDVVAVLESARGYLHTHADPVACPLCESAEKIDGLRERVEQRLTSFTALRKAQAGVKPAESTLATAEARLQAAMETLAQRAADFEAARGATWPDDVPLPPSPTPTLPDDLAPWLAAAEPLAASWKLAKDRRADRQQTVAKIKSELATYRQNFDEQKALDTLLPQLANVLKIAEEERRKFTDEILSAIAVSVGRLYEAVHVGEGLDKISLALDPKKRASLAIESSFEGKTGLPPQAYLSESHLDTLGLCIFLALAGLDNAADTVLVLDDVIASVDEPHVDRLIEMLYDEAEKFRHCLITTHYRPWKQKHRWGWLKNGQCQFAELTKWTNEHGMTLIRSIPDVERLRMLLAESPPDPQLICAKAGVILEAALDFLTQLYECAVPRRSGGHYTLGDLLPSINKKLRTALLVEVQVKDSAGAISYQSKSLTPALNELTRIAQARNVFGCHFNALSFELLESDGVGFGQQVLELMETLADPEAGWPKNSKSGKYFANAGETRRLHPLQQPT